MSASSKKKLRKEQESAKLTEQQIAAQKEAKKLNLYTIAFVVVLAALLLVAVVVGVGQTIANSGIREKNTVAMTVDSHEINNVEMNYFYIDSVNGFFQQYGSYAAMFGLDASKPLNEQFIDEEKTWADDFLTSAKENAKAVYAVADAANAAGFALTEEQLTDIEQSIANIAVYAKLYGFDSADAYLQAMYGKGANTKSFTEYTKLTTLANAYLADYAQNLSYSDADLKALDSEDPTAFNGYTYNSYYLSASSFLMGGTTDEEGNTTYSDEEKAAAAAAAENAAKGLVGGEFLTAEDFDAAIAALPVNKDKTASSTKSTSVLGSAVSTTYGEWVKDAARISGDMAYFPSTTTVDDVETVIGYYIVRFESSTDNTMDLKDVRHILLGFEGGTKDETTGATTYSDEEKAAAKTAAEEVLAQWKAGEATEESFAALANEKSSDGDGTTGGLYENVYPGQMVVPFNDWCFDASRKAGDTDIVETQFGYHVMYFVGNSDYTYRNFMLENQLRNTDAQAWYEETVAAATVSDGDTSYIRMDLVMNQK